MRLAPIGHDDRLSVVDHLDELRARLFGCAAVLFIAFCVCFWQNHHLINWMNRALPKKANSPLTNTGKADRLTAQGFANEARVTLKINQELAQSGVPAGVRATLQAYAATQDQLVKQLHRTENSEQNKPLTIGVGESFTATLTVAAYFALLFAMPFILYQLYAFILPALNPHEKRVALPAMLAAPILFATGAVFTFFAILPPAIHFLQGYNDDEFYVLVSAGTYYKFEVIMMGAIGLAFQVPLLLLALQRIGVVSSQTLRGNWRYGIVIIAVVAAALPGTDPVSMVFETAPLLLLYLASILLLTAVERRDRRREAHRNAL